MKNKEGYEDEREERRQREGGGGGLRGVNKDEGVIDVERKERGEGK